MTATRWPAIYAILLAVAAVIFGLIFMAIPRDEEGAILWTDPMIEGGWMAWTFPISLFFFIIGCLLIIFTILAIRYPETPRVGILRIETTRGDRLFITLLGSAFISLAWLFFFGAPLTYALILCLVYAFAVFRWV